MNIAFVTLGNMEMIHVHSIYTDLLREFSANGHSITVICPCEKKYGKPTHVFEENGIKLIRVRTGNLQKVSNLIEKGISALRLQGQFISALKQYTKDTEFNLAIYSTPPVTFSKVVRYIKRRDNAKTYLLLKDIWPQGALDIGALSLNGWRGLAYHYFKKKEKELYALSDYIGCMSPANVRYLLEHEPQINPNIIEECPNSIEVANIPQRPSNAAQVRKKYGLPEDKTIYLYGGNIGRPQGVDFIIRALRACESMQDAFFLIVGSGTEFEKLRMNVDSITNVKVVGSMPRNEYDELASTCDVGLIFLDHRFTIPNFPSRLLSYLQAGMPVLCATDTVCDMGRIAEENGFGLWCESTDETVFADRVKELLDNDKREEMGVRGRAYLEANYGVKRTYDIIMKHFEQGKEYVLQG